MDTMYTGASRGYGPVSQGKFDVGKSSRIKEVEVI